MEAIVLAGGLGTRLRGVVKSLPKPMATVQEKPFLEHLIKYAILQGCTHIILSVGYRAHQIIDYFGESYNNVPISYSIEDELRGTGGGVMLASRHLKEAEPFFVLNGDTFCAVSYIGMLDFHKARNANLSIALFKAHRSNQFGKVALSSNGRITAFGAGLACVGDYANAGVYILGQEVVQCFDDFKQSFSFEKEGMPMLESLGQTMYGFYNANGVFVDIGTPYDFEIAQKMSAFSS